MQQKVERYEFIPKDAISGLEEAWNTENANGWLVSHVESSFPNSQKGIFQKQRYLVIYRKEE